MMTKKIIEVIQDLKHNTEKIKKLLHELNSYSQIFSPTSVITVVLT